VECNLSLLRYHASMPAPPNERRSLEQERAELPEQIIAHETELFATPAASKGRRAAGMADPNLRKRLVQVEARLAAIRVEQ
jgi:hypothetical protein